MRNKIIQNIVGSVWALGAANRSQLTSLIHTSSKRRDEIRKLPRYVQRRKLRSGQIAYYWCPPHWARKRGFPLMSESLGLDLDKVEDRVEVLNSYLDKTGGILWGDLRKVDDLFGKKRTHLITIFKSLVLNVVLFILLVE